ncbi:MAG: hypothetical protein J6A01_02630 [Proteobacteria bacterium]|nr:hypothetical protein [Pseudomonadota bacterium]
MRKSLVLALVAAGMLLGCGYDNGKEEPDKLLKTSADAAKDKEIAIKNTDLEIKNKTIDSLEESLASANTAKREMEEAKNNAEEARNEAIDAKNQAESDKKDEEYKRKEAEKERDEAKAENEDLKEQLEALNAEDTEDHYEDFLNFVYTEYMKMIKTKQICLNEKTDIDNLMVMADLTSYVTHDTGSSLASMAKVVKTYASDPETITPVGDDNLDEVKSLIAYFRSDSLIWPAAVSMILQQLLYAGVLDETTYNAISGLSIEELVTALSTNQTFMSVPSNVYLLGLLQDSKFWKLHDLNKNFSIDKSIFGSETFLNEMGKTTMYSQKRLCIETLNGVSSSIAFARFIASPDMQLDACILAPNISSALVNMNKLVTVEKADKILYSGDYDAIHASLLEPRYLWLSNASVMPIDVKLGTDESLISDGDAKGFILETVNNVPNPMFTDNLMGDTYIHAFPAEIEASILAQNETSKTNNETDVVSRARNIVGLKGEEISTRMNYLKTDAKNTDYAFTHTFLYDINDKHNCNINNSAKCRFDLAVVSKKMEDSIASNSATVNTDEPFRCGGFVYNVNKINGYVVLPDGFTGSTSNVEALGGSCSSNWECLDDSGVLVGVCEEGKCKRTCNVTEDCEKNSICDSHVCRRIENCPSMNFSHLDSGLKSKAETKYKNSKCVKVFSHTPSVSFADALTGDAEIKDSKLNEPLRTGDFTSDNYVFTIPNDSLDRGLSFGMITYATIRFINLLSAASNNLAECFRPEALEANTYSYNGLAGLDGGYKYLSDYHYSFSNETLSSSAVFTLCSNGTNDMEYDMMAYAIYQYYVNYNYNGKDPKDNLTPQQAVDKFNNLSLSHEQRIEAITKLYHEIELKLRNKKDDEGGTSSGGDNSESSSESGEEPDGSNS